MDKRFWATVFTLSGTIVGAGILGLPYVFSRSGFFVGVFWLILLGIVMIAVNLYLGEVALRTKGLHHLPGYARLYLGKRWEKVMFFSVVFGIYSALLAYLIGIGNSFGKLFLSYTSGLGYGLNYAVIFGICFWLFMTLLLREGLRGLKEVESYGVIGIVLIIVGIFVWFLPQVDLSNIVSVNYSNFFLPFGVTLFALLGFSAMPEVRMVIKGGEKRLKSAIILGVLIPVILYLFFSFSFVGVMGEGVPEVATLSSGWIVVLLGIFTMMTSYFVLSFALRDIFKYDLLKGDWTNFFYTSLVPLFLYLGVVGFNIGGFVSILGIGGVVSGGLTGILALFIVWRAKKRCERKPEYEVPINWFIVAVLILIFILGVIVESIF